MASHGETAEAVAAANHRGAQGLQLSAGLHRTLFQGAAEIGKAFLVYRIGIPPAFFVRTADEKEFLQQVSAKQGAPAAADEGPGQLSQSVVGVLAARREDLDFAEA